MKNLNSLLKSLISEGYKKISLTELAFHYRRQYKANVDEQQLRKALVRSGVLGSMIRDGVLTLNVSPLSDKGNDHLTSDKSKASDVMPQFNKLPKKDTSKISKEDPK